MSCTKHSISAKYIYGRKKSLSGGTKAICGHRPAAAVLSGEMSLELQQAVCWMRV